MWNISETQASQLKQIGAYVCVGCIGVAVNLGSFAFLLALGVHYLAASVAAFACATCVGFVLQKVWTFSGETRFATPLQFALYAITTSINAGLNTAIVYGAVRYLTATPVMGQAAGAAIVAIASFFVYKHGIFRAR